MNLSLRCAVATAALTLLAGCGARPAATSTGWLGDSRTIDSLSAFQSRNPDWSVDVDHAGRIIAATRVASALRTDIRPELVSFLRTNAVEFPASAPGMHQTEDEPEHVHFEKREAGRIVLEVDARLDAGRIVIIGRSVAHRAA